MFLIPIEAGRKIMSGYMEIFNMDQETVNGPFHRWHYSNGLRGHDLEVEVVIPHMQCSQHSLTLLPSQQAKTAIIATSEVKRPRRSFLTSELNSSTSITIRSIPILPLVRGHGLGGQTASEVIFDLRNELLGLRNHKIDTHIATIKRPWPPRS